MRVCCGGKISKAWKTPTIAKLGKRKVGDPCVYCDGTLQIKMKRGPFGGWKQVLACSVCSLEVGS